MLNLSIRSIRQPRWWPSVFISSLFPPVVPTLLYYAVSDVH
jgi:hypothetical protein